MLFLIPADFESYIKKENLDVLTDLNPTILSDVAFGAQLEVASYLADRYDLATLLPPVFEYDPSGEYAEGDLVAWSPGAPDPVRVFSVHSPPPAGTLPSDVDFYAPKDPRNPLVKRCIIDVALYELHSRINPRNIPEFRIAKRDDAIQWLKRVADPRNNINPDFPLKPQAAGSGLDVTWRSNPKINHHY
jgi:hypothetical protein